MGLKVENKQLDDRTMEKIRLRAKLSSIVHAMDAKEQIEHHKLAQPDITDDSGEHKEMKRIHSNLDSVIMPRFKVSTTVNLLGNLALEKCPTHTVLTAASRVSASHRLTRQLCSSGCCWQPTHTQS